MSDTKTLVSCIMPTYNRRAFVPHAIRYFLRQNYPYKELIIIDDGTDTVADLIPDVPSIHYYQLPQKITLGAKLNMACEYSKGNIIANWNDDDWYASRRLQYQVNALYNEGVELCGINQLLYYDMCNKKAFQYFYPANQRVWLAGSSLCYTKELWVSKRYAEINIGEDGLFVWSIATSSIMTLSDSTISVHMIHKANICPKKTDGGWWYKYSVDEIRKIMNSDWVFYNNNSIYTR